MGYFYMSSITLLLKKQNLPQVAKWKVERKSQMHFINQVPLAVIPTGIYLFKVKKEITRVMCEICSKLRISTPEAETYSEPSRTSKITLLGKIFNGGCYLFSQKASS